MDAVFIITVTVLLLFVTLPLLFFLRRGEDLSIEDGNLLIQYPLKNKEINLEKELQHWEIQKATYFWIGTFYAILLHMKHQKKYTISSLYNRKSYHTLHNYLSENFADRKQERKD